MKLDFTLIATTALVESSGVFSLLEGGVVSVNAKKLPATKHQLCLLTFVFFSEDECGRTYQSKVRVVAPNGNNLAP